MGNVQFLSQNRRYFGRIRKIIIDYILLNNIVLSHSVFVQFTRSCGKWKLLLESCADFVQSGGFLFNEMATLPEILSISGKVENILFRQMSMLIGDSWQKYALFFTQKVRLFAKSKTHPLATAKPILAAGTFPSLSQNAN